MPMVFLCTALIFGAALVGTEGFQRTPLRSFKGISYDSSSTKLEALRSKETNNFYPFSNAFESSSSSSSLARSKQSTTTKPGSTTSTALEAVISEVSPLEKGPGMTETPGFWRFIILIVTILWATNFSVIKEIYAAVPGLDAPFYSAVRMTIGAAVLAPAALKRISNTEMAWQSVGVGFVISLGYVGQGIGLETSTSDKAAFLCAMQVVWVALVNSIRYTEFKLQTWVAVGLAIVGTGFIELCGVSAPTVGDAWLLLQPIGFGTGYLTLEHVIKKHPEDALAITGFKLLGVALCMDLWALGSGHTIADIAPILDSPTAMACLAYTGAITTAGCIYLQSVSFKKVSAADASIIISSEPIWAVLIAYSFLGEKLSNFEVFGGFLIMLGGFVYEFKLIDRLTGQYVEEEKKDSSSSSSSSSSIEIDSAK